MITSRNPFNWMNSTKPFQLDELYIVVKNAVDRIKLIRENNALLIHLKQAMEQQMLPFENTEIQNGLQQNNAELLKSLRTQLLKVYNRTGQPYPHIP